MITFKLTNTDNTHEFTVLEAPFQESTIEGAQDIETLDHNISTYFTSNKRRWSHKWAYMTKNEYDVVRSFYDSQFTDFKYPLFTCDFLGVENVPVRMKITDRPIVDNCGGVENIEINLRETRQS